MNIFKRLLGRRERPARPARPTLWPIEPDPSSPCIGCAKGFPLDERGVHVQEDWRWWMPCTAKKPPAA